MLQFRVPSTSRLFFTRVVPVAAPITTVVPADAMFTVVGVARRFTEDVVALISPPDTERSPVILASFLTVVVPVVAPRVRAVAEAPMFIVVDWTRALNVDADEVRSPPFTAKSPVRVTFPVTPRVPATVALFLTAVVPVDAPILIEVAS